MCNCQISHAQDLLGQPNTTICLSNSVQNSLSSRHAILHGNHPWQDSFHSSMPYAAHLYAEHPHILAQPAGKNQKKQDDNMQIVKIKDHLLPGYEGSFLQDDHHFISGRVRAICCDPRSSIMEKTVADPSEHNST